MFKTMKLIYNYLSYQPSSMTTITFNLKSLKTSNFILKDASDYQYSIKYTLHPWRQATAR